MTFARLLRADAVAMVAALALLLVIGTDWYSTTAGEEARRIERVNDPSGGTGGQVSRAVEERARVVAEEAEKNAIQVTGVVDRVILAGLVATALLALGAGYLRAAGRRFRPPLTPSALAAAGAAVTGLLVAYRALDEPGSDAATTVQAGLPLALVGLGAIGLSCVAALRAEEAGTAWREPPAASAADAPAGEEEEQGEPAEADDEATPKEDAESREDGDPERRPG